MLARTTKHILRMRTALTNNKPTMGDCASVDLLDLDKANKANATEAAGGGKKNTKSDNKVCARSATNRDDDIVDDRRGGGRGNVSVCSTLFTIPCIYDRFIVSIFEAPHLTGPGMWGRMRRLS